MVQESLIYLQQARLHPLWLLQRLLLNLIPLLRAAQETQDGLAIHAVKRFALHGAVMETYADHRMATFAALIGLIVPGIDVVNVATTRKTIPDFVGLWTAMLEEGSND